MEANYHFIFYFDVLGYEAVRGICLRTIVTASSPGLITEHFF